MNESAENKTSPALDWRDAVTIIVLICLILMYFRSLLWTDRYIYGELDIRRHFYLFKQVSFELMRAGEAPLWIPYLYCGMPLLAASQVTPFYPVDLALMSARVPLNMVFNWDLLVHLIAAQLFSYLFFKRLFGRGIATVFCSMWFWNMFFLNSIITGDALNIRAMLLVPMVFYFVEAGLEEQGQPRYFLFGAVALSMQILCGGLQFTFYTMAGVTAYAVFILVARARRKDEVIRPMLGFAAMIVVALAIASVQLLPAWEYSRLSVRGTGILWFKAWALKPYQLLDYVIPMFQGKGRGHGYFGIACIVLAAYSLAFWRSPRKHFFLLLGAISIIYSMGGNTLVSSWLAGLPLVRDFRGPFRAAILFDLSAFALAGGALVSLLSPDGALRDRYRMLKFAVAGIALAGGFTAAAISTRGYPGWSATGVAVSAVFLALSLLAVFSLLISKRFRGLAAVALIVILAADLAFNYLGLYSPTSTRELFEKDWTVRFLEEDRGDASSRIAVYNTAHTNYFGLFGIESANGHHPFPLARCARFLPLLQNPNVASLAGVKHNVVYALGEDDRPYNPPLRHSEEATVAGLPLQPLPRAFLVEKYRVLPPEEIPGAMQKRGFDPGKEVLLEEEPAGFDTGGAAVDFSPGGSASIVSRTANEISLETMSERDAILVLSESYYPGWEAEIDGTKAKVLRANYVFRAVCVPEGGHTVVFTFRPASFSYGMALTCVGIIAWLSWALLLWLKRGL